MTPAESLAAAEAFAIESEALAVAADAVQAVRDGRGCELPDDVRHAVQESYLDGPSDAIDRRAVIVARRLGWVTAAVLAFSLVVPGGACRVTPLPPSLRRSRCSGPRRPCPPRPARRALPTRAPVSCLTSTAPDLDPWMPPRRAVADVVGIGSVECRCGAVRIEAFGEVRSAAAVCPICGQSLEVIGS